MRILSLLSFFSFYSFTIIGIYIFNLNRKQKLNWTAAAVNFCFAIWAFSYTFFFGAETMEIAQFWHKVSSIGWIMFCPFAAHFFLILSEKVEKYDKCYFYLIYILPLILLIKTFISKESPIASSFVQSKSGLGWTYILNCYSIWFWLYVFHIIIYFTFVLFITFKWAKETKRLRFIKQVQCFIILDAIMICVGITTDLIIPAFSTIIPPILSILLVIWGVGLLYIIKSYKLISINDVATPDLILGTVMDPILLIDNNGIITKCNQATAALLKYDLKDIIGRPMYEFCYSQEFNQINEHQLLEEKKLIKMELDLVDLFGNKINTMAAFSLVESELDGFVGIVVNLHEVTEYKKLVSTFENLANYDKLTKIPNRRLFFEKLKAAIEEYKISKTKFALIYFDLDGFKKVNDSYGHDVGDKLLKKVVKMLQSAIREKDILARIGGDEFALICSNLEDETDLGEILIDIEEKFLEPIDIEGNICDINVSYGISQCPRDGDSIEPLVKKADERMYTRKFAKRAVDK